MTFFFKLSAIFHMWAPRRLSGGADAGDGPLGHGVQGGGIAVFMRVLYIGVYCSIWLPLLAFFRGAMHDRRTMAIRQTGRQAHVGAYSPSPAGYMGWRGWRRWIAGHESGHVLRAMLYVLLLPAPSCPHGGEAQRGGTTHRTDRLAVSAFSAAVMICIAFPYGIPPTVLLVERSTSSRRWWIKRVFFGWPFIGFCHVHDFRLLLLFAAKAMYRDLAPEEEHSAAPLHVPVFLPTVLI